MEYAVLVGIAPIVVAFIAGFLGVTVGIGWPVYVAWFAVCLAVGGGVTALNRSKTM